MRIERELMRGAGPVAILKLLDPAPSPETPGMLDSPARTLRFAIARTTVALLIAVASIAVPTATAQDANAYDAWTRLFDRLQPGWDDPTAARSPGFFTPDEHAAIEAWQQGPLEPPRGAALAYLEKAESIAPLIRELRGTPRFDAGIDLDEGFMLLLPHLAPMREICRVSSNLARRATISGDVGGVVEWLGTLNEISAHAGQDGTAIGSLVGAAMYQRSDQTMELAIANGMIDAATAATILESLSTLREARDPFHFGDSVAGERLLFTQSLEAILGKDGAPPSEDVLAVYRSAFGDRFIESITELPDGGDGVRDTMNDMFDRIQLAFDDPDRDRGIETLAGIEAELDSPEVPEIIKTLLPSMTLLARARLRVERILNDRIRGLDAVASGRIPPDGIRNAAILWQQIGRGMLGLPEDAQRAGLDLLAGTPFIEHESGAPGAAESPEVIWRNAYAPVASRWLTLGLDAAAISEADFDEPRGPQSDADECLAAIRSAARGYLADAAGRLRRAVTMPASDEDGITPENERYLAANEIAVTLSLAAHLIRDPGVARVRLAAAIIEDIASLLATRDARAMRIDPVLRMLIADAAAKLPRLDGLDASTATRTDASRFVTARLGDLPSDAAQASATALAALPPGRLYSIFAVADDRAIIPTESPRPPRESVTEPFADLDDLFPYRSLDVFATTSPQAELRSTFQRRLGDVRDRPAEAGRLLGELELGPTVQIRRAADAAMIRITDIDDFCTAPVASPIPGE